MLYTIFHSFSVDIGKQLIDQMFALCQTVKTNKKVGTFHDGITSL